MVVILTSIVLMAVGIPGFSGANNVLFSGGVIGCVSLLFAAGLQGCQVCQTNLPQG